MMMMKLRRRKTKKEKKRKVGREKASGNSGGQAGPTSQLGSLVLVQQFQLGTRGAMRV